MGMLVMSLIALVLIFLSVFVQSCLDREKERVAKHFLQNLDDKYIDHF